MGSLSLLQQIFLTQESNCGLLHCRQIFYQLSYQGRRKLKFWEIKGSAWGHASENGTANPDCLMRMAPPSPSFNNSKKEKKKDYRRYSTDFMSVPWHSTSDWCMCGSVCVAVPGDRTCWERKSANFCFDCYTHPAGKKKGKENVIGWHGENPGRKWDGCSNLPKTSSEAPLTSWYWTREMRNT